VHFGGTKCHIGGTSFKCLAMAVSKLNSVGPEASVSVGPSLIFRVWIDLNVGKWLRVLEQYLQALEQLSHDQNLIPF
jgi:hypothetical protein